MTTRNSALLEAFAGDVVLVDQGKAPLVTALLTHLSADDKFQAHYSEGLSVDLASDDFWRNPYGQGEHPFRPYVVTNGILQIPIQGVLLDKFSYQFGRYATGYQYIERALNRGLADMNVRGIALVSDSPGGMVSGCFELADKIHAARGEKPIRAFAMDHAYSAAYALASSASQVSVSRSGGTGSVGVVTAHVSYEKALEAEGIKVTFIFAGKHKVDGNSYQDLSDDAKARIQQRIDKIYGVFTGTVSRNRGIEDSAVRSTEALTYDAEASVEVGFADRIGSLEEELVAFVDSFNTDDADEELRTEEGTMTTFTQEQLDQAVAAARTEAANTARNEGATAERERVNAIMSSDAAKSRPKAAAKMVTRGLDAALSIELLGDMPEEKAEGTQQPQGRTPFQATMDRSDNPGVGADAPGGEPMDDDAKAIAAVVGAAQAYHGKPKKAA